MHHNKQSLTNGVHEGQRVEVVQRRERIGFIAKHSVDSHLVFFRDCTFHHVDSINRVVLHQGKLDFAPSRMLNSNTTDRVVVMGEHQEGLHCAVIDVQSGYTVESRQVEGGKPEAATAYHLYESQKEDEFGIFLIRVQRNIENGIAVAVFDFRLAIWCEQMLALSSKLLNYRLIPTPACDHLYTEPADLSSHSFALISQGEKLDFLNYSKIKFSLQTEGTDKVLRLIFVITRELRLNRQMTVVGGLQSTPDQLLVVGNGHRESPNPQQVRHGSALVTVNTAAVENNEPQELRMVGLQLGRESRQCPQVRSVAGIWGGAMIVVMVMPFGRIGFARIGLEAQEFLCESECKVNAPLVYRLSITKDCLYKYELQCEPFFEKIKKAPSKISYSIVKIYDKIAHYRHMLKSAFPGLDPFFVKEVLSLL